MKLLVTDLDGTLLGREKKISEKVHRAVDKWKDAGHALVIATGRLYPSAAFYRDELKMQRELICCSGAVIYHEKETLLEHTLPEDIAQGLWDVAKENDVYVQYYSHDLLISNFEGDFMKGYAKSNAKKDPIHRVHVEVREEFRSSEPIHKLSFVTHDPSQAKKIIAQMGPMEGVHVFRSLPFLYDIISDKGNKGTGALFMKERIGAEKVYGIGDNENDVALMELADHSACMDGAPEDVKKAANVLVPDADHDGVAAYIEAILEGRY